MSPRGDGKPGRPSEGQSATLNMRIDPELLERVQSAADKRGEPVSDFVRESLEMRLRRRRLDELSVRTLDRARRLAADLAALLGEPDAEGER